MITKCLSKEYEDELDEFIRFVVDHAKDPGGASVHVLKDHLVCNGINRSYTCWTWHSETRDEFNDLGSNERYDTNDANTNTYDDDFLEEIAKVVKEDLQDCPEMFTKLENDAKEPLYSGCTKFTRFSTILKLYNLKESNGWSDKSFTKLLKVLKLMLPKDNMLASRTCEAK